MPFILKHRRLFSIFAIALITLSAIYLPSGLLDRFTQKEVEAAEFAELELVLTPGSTGEDTAIGTSVDGSGNMYVVGRFSGTVDFDENNVVSGDTHVSAGNTDAFLAKYNSSGVLQWVKTPGGTGLDYGEGVEIDPSGYIYITGFYAGTADLDEDNVVSGDTLTTFSGTNTFLAKYDSTGLLIWAKDIGGTGDSRGFDLDIDSTGNVYVTGQISGNTDFDKQNVVSGDTHNTAGLQDTFIAKYNSSGVLQWVNAIGGAGPDVGRGVAVDSASGAVFATGQFYDTVDFDENNVVSGDTHVSNESYDIYIAKYNSSGALQWVKTPGSASGFITESGWGIDVDSSGDVYAAGMNIGTTDFDEDNVTPGDTPTEYASLNDLFIVKYNSAGDFQWVHNDLGGNFVSRAEDLRVDSNDNVYITGVGPQIYIAKFDSSGNYLWRKMFGGLNTTSSRNFSINIDSSGLVYAAGRFGSTTTDFDQDNVVSGDTHTTAGSADMYIARYSTFVATSITGAPASFNFIDTATSLDATTYQESIVGPSRNILMETTGGIPLAEVSVDLTQDRDWTSAGITGDSDAGTYKSFVHNLTTADGTAATFTLYIPMNPSDTGVIICPGADSLGAVTESCPGAYTLPASSPSVSIENVGGNDYWKVEGVSGTGGLGTSSVISVVNIDLDPQPATSPSTISSAPEVAVSTTDQFYLAYTPSVSEFAASDYVDIVIPQDWVGLAVCSSPADADGDSANDHTAALENSQIIRYTFTGATTTALATGVEFCFEAQTPAVSGNYSIAVSDTNDGDYGAALIYVGDDNDVTVTATVPATLSLRIKDSITTADTNTCGLGVLNPASVNSCAYRLAAGTNSVNGVEVYVIADDQLNTSTPTTDIDDVAGGGTVVAGNEEHGIMLTLGTPFTAGGSFTEITDEPVPLVETLIIESAAGVSDSVEANWTTITHSASVNSATEAGSYDQIVTYRAWIGT